MMCACESNLRFVVFVWLAAYCIVPSVCAVAYEGSSDKRCMF